MRSLSSRMLYPLCVLLLCLLCACSPLGKSTPQGTTLAPPSAPSGEVAPEEGNPPEAALAEQGETVATDEEAPGEDTPVFLNCPRPGDLLYLAFEHDIVFDAMGMASLQHTVPAQAIVLQAVETGGERVLIENDYADAGDALNVYISGSVGTCTAGGSAKLVPTVAGHCEDGIVWLTIYEEWKNHEMTITCDDGPAMPFALPDSSYKHAGADEGGLDFWLVDGEPAVREVPFVGAGGGGVHRWVLYADPLTLPADLLNDVLTVGP